MKSHDSHTGQDLLLLSMGTALVGGGAAAMLGEPLATWIMAGALPIAIAIAIVATAWLSVDATQRAAETVIVAPFALFLYAVAAGVTIRYYPGLGWLLVALGTALVAVAVRSRLAAAPRARRAGAEPISNRPAHQGIVARPS
jgi:energy-converting hydrogenase Eha subunit C